MIKKIITISISSSRNDLVQLVFFCVFCFRLVVCVHGKYHSLAAVSVYLGPVSRRGWPGVDQVTRAVSTPTFPRPQACTPRSRACEPGAFSYSMGQSQVNQISETKIIPLLKLVFPLLQNSLRKFSGLRIFIRCQNFGFLPGHYIY
jgi:hypothetical protein